VREDRRRKVTTRIDVQKIPPEGFDAAADPVVEVPLLPGAIEEVEARYCLQRKGVQRTAVPQPGKTRVFLFFFGAGEVHSSGESFVFSEVASFAGRANAPVSIRATSTRLEYVEITVTRVEEESTAPRSRAGFFVLYSQCDTYREAIKSAATVSRTIIPPDVVPRFCMGSVEAVGPDEVGAHAHPMLEQLFWGLPGSEGVVTADEAAAVFGERMLLHVPLGSRHGVRVHAGKRLHYVWMDFFRTAEDLTYIHRQHSPTRSQL
jgi:hypothetical protein